MKKITILFALVFWMIFTLILACSIVGFAVLIREDHNCKKYQGEAGEAVWFKIGKQITNELIKP